MADDHELEGSKRHVVVLSDIHLGTDVPTVWFQPSVHGAALERILRWVASQAEHISELVLLGDVADLWTYPASMVPPTFADIVAAHPDVLGPNGSIAACLDALDGAVTFVPGNHDMGVTAEEAALVRSGRTGRALRFTEGVHRVNDDVVVEHGHHHTLFNAPSEISPWAPLPLGYFVTRAVATGWARDLEPGRTVADLAGQGAPNGLDLDALGSVAGGIGAASIAAALVDIVSSTTKVSLDEPIHLPDGRVATLREARLAYADVWTRWAEAHGGGIVGHGVAYRSAMADADGTYLGWFAQRRALEEGADLVVMGHTHAPIGGLEDALVDYVNSGFDCPSRPDQERDVDPQRVTFVVIDTEPEGGQASVWAVGDDLSLAPIDAPTTRVIGDRGHDFSCYVVVDNTAGSADLVLVDHGAANGAWVVPPPAVVAAGDEGRFWLQDLLGAAGSDGWATYRRARGGDGAVSGGEAGEGEGDDEGDDEGEVFELRFACPTVGTNSCSGATTFSTRTGSDEWRDQRVAHWGHPFSVAYEFR